jgi:hypothetical protein
MGLDMYLNKKTFVSNATIIVENQPLQKIQSKRITSVSEQIAYWRKSNQIHGWFIKNCHEITPDVRYYVNREDLVQLLEVCKQVKTLLDKSITKVVEIENGFSRDDDGNINPKFVEHTVFDCDQVLELLPPTDGFFYGNQSLDDYYYNGIILTIEILEKELSDNLEDDIDISYEYYASW